MMSRVGFQSKSVGGSVGFSRACPDCQKKKLVGNPLQTKLPVTEPVDEYEREADRMAEQVMRLPDVGVGRAGTKAGHPLVQRLKKRGVLLEAPPVPKKAQDKK